MHRRQFLSAAAMATATLPLASLPTLAQTPTPAEGSDTLAGRVNAIAPETFLEALLTTPVSTPLVPRDTPEVESVPWEDESDSDLDGAVGGVLFQTGIDVNDNPLVISTAIVMPDADVAASRMAEVNPSALKELYGLPFFAEDFGDYAVAVVQVGFLLLAGGAEGQDTEPPVGHDNATPSPMPIVASGRHHLRAVANLAATLDHLEDVLASLDA